MLTDDDNVGGTPFEAYYQTADRNYSVFIFRMGFEAGMPFAIDRIGYEILKEAVKDAALDGGDAKRARMVKGACQGQEVEYTFRPSQIEAVVRMMPGTV